MTARDPSFAIPSRPERTYPRSGGVEYEGETVFELAPDGDANEGAGRDEDADEDGDGDEHTDLASLVETVLADGPYRFGDFHELPMALYLVRDEGTTDVFRVAVRDGTVRLHVLPETDSAGLRRFYDRLDDRSAVGWRVECHTDFE